MVVQRILYSAYFSSPWRRFIPAATKVHIITEATLPGNTGNAFIAGDVEVFLIQLFGYNALLNSQLGGYYCNYLPSAEDDELFKSLQKFTSSVAC